MYKETIGLVGGFGAYATLEFYKKIVDKFMTDKERDIPRIIMDNNFTMPSRTRALLYNEEVELIIQEIAKSIAFLHNGGATKIILVCGTAHVFLEKALDIVPQAKGEICNIIIELCEILSKNKVRKVAIIAAEGSLKIGLYNPYLANYNIKFETPEVEEYEKIRYFIERVKKNQIDELVIKEWYHYVTKYIDEECRDIILGCTEFPILKNEMLSHAEIFSNEENKLIREMKFWDPLECMLEKLYTTIK